MDVCDVSKRGCIELEDAAQPPDTLMLCTSQAAKYVYNSFVLQPKLENARITSGAQQVLFCSTVLAFMSAREWLSKS
jgi:hypothetical protein